MPITIIMAQRIAGPPDNTQLNSERPEKEVTTTTCEDKTGLNVGLITDTGDVTVQNPLPSDGDSVYCKDIDIENSEIGDFSGEVCDFFNDLTSISTNTTSDNPKILTIRFKRSLQTSSIGIGCNDTTKSFSNVIVKLLGSGDEIRQIIDLSSDNTKYNSLVPKFIPDTANGIILEFHTPDQICLSNLIIYKSINNNSRIQALDEITGEIINIEGRDGKLNVAPEYKNDIPADYYLYRTDTTQTITSDTSIDDTVINVTDTTGVVVGDAITIYEDISMFQSLVTATTATTITISSPLDYEFTTGAIVETGVWSMNVDGSTIPQIFSIKAPPNKRLHLHTIGVSMLDATAMDDGKFGGITALTNGVIFRIENDFIKNLALIVNNLGFWENGFETSYVDQTLGPAGQYGFRARRKLPEINGTILQLEKEETSKFEIIIRDDLTDLNQMTTTINGHLIPD